MSLGKQKYYCEMCKRQNKDANALSQHKRTAFHQQRMLDFNADPDKYINRFSEEFESSFLEMVKMKYGPGVLMPINKAYNEFINDSHRVHLNSTRWATLTDFAMYLEASGLAEVRKEKIGDSEQLCIQLIDKKEHLEKTMTDQERRQNIRDQEKKREAKELEKLIKKASKMKQSDGLIISRSSDDIQQQEKDKPLELKLGGSFQMSTNLFNKGTVPKAFGIKKDEADNKSQLQLLSERSQLNKSNLDKLLEHHSYKAPNPLQKPNIDPKDKQNSNQSPTRKAPRWTFQGLVVKIKSQGHHQKEKAEVLKAEDRDNIKLKLLSTQEILNLKEDDLSIVLPGEGGKVMVLKDRREATVSKIDMTSRQLVAKLDDNGEAVTLNFSDVCKLNQ